MLLGMSRTHTREILNKNLNESCMISELGECSRCAWSKDPVVMGENREWVAEDTENTTEPNNDILNKLERISF